PVVVPESDGFLDGRPTLLPGVGGLWMVQSADRRSQPLTGNPRYGITVSALDWVRGLPAPAALTPTPPPGPRDSGPPTSAERADVGRVRGFQVRLGGQVLRPLRGDFHRHTEISFDGGGDGPLVDMFRYAIDAAAQDWICAGDHDYGNGREYSWWQIQKLDDAYHVGTAFVPIFGYERSVAFPDGHRNVMFAQRGIRALPRLAGGPNGRVSPDDTTMLYRYLRQFHGICARHTSATNQGTDWRDNDPELEPFVEIYQGDRQSYEYEGAPRSPTPGNVAPAGFEPAGFVRNALAKG